MEWIVGRVYVEVQVLVRYYISRLKLKLFFILKPPGYFFKYLTYEILYIYLQGSKSGSNSSKKNSFFDRTGLKQKNKVLAATLNQTRIQNAALCQKLNQMKGEIFDLKGENVELRREKQAISATARLTESDIQRKLEVRICFMYSYNS